MTIKSVPQDERWELGVRASRYRCAPRNKDEQRQLTALGLAEFDALSIGRRGDGPQVCFVPLDESSEAHARLLVSAPELCELVRSAVKGGPLSMQQIGRAIDLLGFIDGEPA